MPVQLNHTIVWCRDKKRSSAFLTRILGCAPAVRVLPFYGGPTGQQRFARFHGKGRTYLGSTLCIDENEFEATFSRIRDEGLSYWADPGKSQPKEINPTTAVAVFISKILMGTCSRSSRAPVGADENLIIAARSFNIHRIPGRRLPYTVTATSQYWMDVSAPPL